jgi:hypothetical protein
MVPETGKLPVATLDGGLRLTLLGPACASTSSVRPARRARRRGGACGPEQQAPDLLGRRDTWPPIWQDGEQRDPSAANGSSIMLLASTMIMRCCSPATAHAPDLAAALNASAASAICRQRHFHSPSRYPHASQRT